MEINGLMLLETLQHSVPARIINISSDAQQYGNMDFDDLGFQRGYTGMKAYARSKLANILFTYELSRRLEGTGVTVNALHPGHVAADIWGIDFPLIGSLLRWLMGIVVLTPEEGADNSIYLASSQDVAKVTRCYFIKRKAVQSSPLSYDAGVSQRLWEVSEDLTAPYRMTDTLVFSEKKYG